MPCVAFKMRLFNFINRNFQALPEEVNKIISNYLTPPYPYIDELKFLMNQGPYELYWLWLGLSCADDDDAQFLNSQNCAIMLENIQHFKNYTSKLIFDYKKCQEMQADDAYTSHQADVWADLSFYHFEY